MQKKIHSIRVKRDCRRSKTAKELPYPQKTGVEIDSGLPVKYIWSFFINVGHDSFGKLQIMYDYHLHFILYLEKFHHLAGVLLPANVFFYKSLTVRCDFTVQFGMIDYSLNFFSKVACVFRFHKNSILAVSKL